MIVDVAGTQHPAYLSKIDAEAENCAIKGSEIHGTTGIIVFAA